MYRCKSSHGGNFGMIQYLEEHMVSLSKEMDGTSLMGYESKMSEHIQNELQPMSCTAQDKF